MSFVTQTGTPVNVEAGAVGNPSRITGGTTGDSPPIYGTNTVEDSLLSVLPTFSLICQRLR